MRALLLSAALACTLVGQVWAQSAKVVIVSLNTCCPDEAWLEAEQITRTEFTALDFEVQVVPGAAQSEKERREELIKLAQQNEAAAALRIVREQGPAKGGVELWVSNRSKEPTCIELGAVRYFSRRIDRRPWKTHELPHLKKLLSCMAFCPLPQHVEDMIKVPETIFLIVPLLFFEIRFHAFIGHPFN